MTVMESSFTLTNNIFDVLDKLNRISCYLESNIIRTRRTKAQYTAQQIINRAIKLARADYNFSSAHTKACNVRFGERKVVKNKVPDLLIPLTEVHIDLHSNLTRKRKRVILYV